MSNKCALSGWDANQGLRFDLFVLVSWQLYSLSQIYSIHLLGARKRVLMPHRFLYDIVSSAHETSMCLGKKGADPPCTSYHRVCPAGRSPLAKQRLTRFDQVLNSGSKERISFR